MRNLRLMDEHLGYSKSERSDNDDYRNGYKSKRVNSSYGSMEIDVPQDRKSTFEPQVVKKRQKDISDIDQKIISMYAKGMTTRQISETIEDIYGFETSEGFISDVTDKIMPQIEDWQNPPLDEVYPIVYIDAIHYSVRDNGVIRKLVAYVIFGLTVDGRKDVLACSASCTCVNFACSLPYFIFAPITRYRSVSLSKCIYLPLSLFVNIIA